ncbi:hypothetical protein J7382_04110 [Shimia sp. R11_0]|uniref:hypothetical protein n=1 Tax=Shimia sp. R11_0 TaxID=2821096 RepID=UPI001ADAB3E0|nr:hypothetical protein [Shimia sp. R11_0]MBO9476713.1 hypothetical protein [Shimia sp. R11_0]
MPLNVLLVLVIGGIAGIAGLTYVLGMSRRRAFQTVEDARAAWVREYPLSEVVEVELSQNGYVALVRTKRSIGVVWTMGDDSCARILRHAKVERHAQGLRLKLNDFTAPVIRLPLSGAEQARWAAQIEGQT